MKELLLNKLTSALWTCIVLVIVGLAVYTSVGRLVTSNLSSYRLDFLRELNAHLNFVVEVDQLEGEWESFRPRVRLRGIRLLGHEHSDRALEMETLVAEINVWQSLRQGDVQFHALAANGVQMHVDIDDQGRLSLLGIPVQLGGGTGNPIFDPLFNAALMSFEDVTLNLHEGAGERQLFVETKLQREQEFRRFQLSLLSPSRQARLRLIGEGEGRLQDLQKFEGRFHLETSLGDVADYKTWLSALGFSGISGALDAELWGSLQGGHVEIAADLGGRELVVRPPLEGANPLQISSFDASASASYREGIWQLGLSDISLHRGEQRLDFDDVSASYDGQSLQARSAGVALQGLVNYLLDDRVLPEAGHKMLSALAPGGRFERLQLTLPDVNQPQHWRLEANFRDLSVQAVGRAPGVTNADGYLSLNAREGRLQIDSSDFRMAFPRLYREPLAYSSFSAELAWELREDLLSLRSGPFTGFGEEGQVRGLFSLLVPREKTDIGVEMELMVGLRESHPRHRHKYLPHTLSENLRGWLRQSIGEGSIDQGAFFWRGSFKSAPHRTVQLFFEVSDTALDYHPQWPALENVSGLVLIDNAAVDVYADSARLLDSQASDVKVELRSAADAGLMLSLLADLEGSASDGLHLVNHSPLRALVGDTFSGWQLEGALQTRLALQLKLGDSGPAPVVEVVTDWSDTVLRAVPLNLQVDNIGGRLRFDSAAGFSAENLQGRLWGRPVSVQVSQAADAGGPGLLDIAATGSVDVADLRDWLDLDLLQFAQGRAESELHILVPPDAGAYLTASSQLDGVSLDLPEPWGKPAGQARSLQLTMPLTGTERRLVMNLWDELYLGVLLDESGYAGGSLGFAQLMQAEEPGYFLVGGDVERLDLLSLSNFLDRYVPTETTAAALLGVRNLYAQEMIAFDQHFQQVRVSVRQLQEAWEVQLHTDWLQGRGWFPADFSRLRVALDRLDIGALSEGIAGRLSALEPGGFNLPPTDVSINELWHGDLLWGDVQFKLDKADQHYAFSDIRGELRGLQLGAEDRGMSLGWQAGSDDPSTRIRGRLRFGDLGLVLEQYSYDKIIETESGQVDIDLNWPGSPAEFALAQSGGQLGIDIGAGRFLKTSGATEGTLRVISILNLADFVRRLSLDISYMFQSGVPFDDIRGDLLLEDGQIEVPDMAVSGRSSQFYFAGEANVPQQSIDGELVATLPIASNLPWVAALVSGLPTAAAVYVISKLFTRQMGRFSSASYEVKGSWDNPEVNFQRIFDNSAEKTSTAAGDAATVQGTLQEAAPDNGE